MSFNFPVSSPTSTNPHKVSGKDLVSRSEFAKGRPENISRLTLSRDSLICSLGIEFFAISILSTRLTPPEIRFDKTIENLAMIEFSINFPKTGSFNVFLSIFFLKAKLFFKNFLKKKNPI